MVSLGPRQYQKACCHHTTARPCKLPPRLHPTALRQALQDSGWQPETPEQRQATGVAIGAGMSCTTDMADAGVLLVRCCTPMQNEWRLYLQAACACLPGLDACLELNPAA